MSETFYKIKLDIVHNTISNFIHVMQYDNGVAYIKAELYKDWQQIDPSTEYGSAQLRLRKPNGSWIKCSTDDTHIQVKKPELVSEAIQLGLYYLVEQVYTLIPDDMEQEDYDNIETVYQDIGEVISIESGYIKINIVKELTDVYGGCPAVIDLHPRDPADANIQTAKFVLDVDMNPIQHGAEIQNVPEDVVERLNILSASKQNKSDNALATIDKTIVGAINELFASSGGGSWGEIDGDIEDQEDLMALLNAKEETTNKVALSSTNTTTQYPNAKSVWDECQNLREVAEGKCATYILSCAEIPPSSSSYGPYKYVDKDGNLLATYADFAAYTNGKTLVNNKFNSQDDHISFMVSGFPNGYLIVSTGDYNGIPAKKVIKTYDGGEAFNKGDIFLVTELNVPDRWFVSQGAVYQLETTKVDITSKLDKVTASTYYTQVYAKQNTGAQSMINVSDYSSAATLALRDASGRLKVKDENSLNSYAAIEQVVEVSSSSTVAFEDHKKIINVSGTIQELDMGILNDCSEALIKINSSGSLLVPNLIHCLGDDVNSAGVFVPQANNYYSIFVYNVGNSTYHNLQAVIKRIGASL